MGRPAGAGRRGRGGRGPAHAGRRAAGECDRARAAAPGAVPHAPGAARARRRGGRVSVALVGAPLARRSRHPRDRRRAPVRGGRCRAAGPRGHRAAAHRRGPAAGAAHPRALRTAPVAARRHRQGPAHSRCDATPDNLLGIVYAKDLVPLVLGVAGATVRWQDLVRPALYVPETKTLDSQLRDFQRGPAHLAIVVDEFGGTFGLITLEDIL